MGKKRRAAENHPKGGGGDANELRVIGGEFRGSKLQYHGDPLTRPMKHRVREAVFNLVGIECQGRHAVDLFAGTGALGIEAISRGATGATFIERHVPTARIVQQNIDSLGLAESCQVLTTSAFLWARRDLPGLATGGKEQSASASQRPVDPWMVFCSPPYAFYHERQQEMLDLVDALMKFVPAGSILVVEADEPFDFHLLPGEVAESRKESGWDVRSYPPAVVGVWRT